MDTLSPELAKIVRQLQTRRDVWGIFVTGSTGKKVGPESDVDLVVLLKKNAQNIHAIYTTIDDRFADVFFFEVGKVTAILRKKELLANHMDGILKTWVGQGTVLYDPHKVLHQLAESRHRSRIVSQEKEDVWYRLNYAWLKNVRYYRSQKKEYQQALDFLLLNSVTMLVIGYFTLRDIPWRGEREALVYLQKHAPRYFTSLKAFSKQGNFKKKMTVYQRLFEQTLTPKYPKWKKGFVVPIDTNFHYSAQAKKWWHSLLQ